MLEIFNKGVKQYEERDSEFDINSYNQFQVKLAIGKQKHANDVNNGDKKSINYNIKKLDYVKNSLASLKEAIKDVFESKRDNLLSIKSMTHNELWDLGKILGQDSSAIDIDEKGEVGFWIPRFGAEGMVTMGDNGQPFVAGSSPFSQKMINKGTRDMKFVKSRDIYKTVERRYKPETEKLTCMNMAKDCYAAGEKDEDYDFETARGVLDSMFNENNAAPLCYEDSLGIGISFKDAVSANPSVIGLDNSNDVSEVFERGLELDENDKMPNGHIMRDGWRDFVLKFLKKNYNKGKAKNQVSNLFLG